MLNQQDNTTTNTTKFILLADDDADDCLLFSSALDEITVTTNFETVKNGEELMEYLDKAELLPDIIFLDMNMPRKNGAICLTEIKSIEKLKSIPVIIISTSLEQSLIEFLYANGAHYFIRNTNAFSK
ncbi:MAG: response regulator [Ferruginibacter sp.]|nr:response regulator [Ferruginibacter sp.]